MTGDPSSLPHTSFVSRIKFVDFNCRIQEIIKRNRTLRGKPFIFREEGRLANLLKIFIYILTGYIFLNHATTPLEVKWLGPK